MDSKIRIITDSAADLSPEIASQYGIQVVPLTIRFGDEEFIDGVELTNDAFWQKMAVTSALPATAAPSPGAFEAAFRQAAADGCSAVVCVSLSSKLSATYQAAINAQRAVEGVIDVRVIDSMACAIAQRSLCVEAANAAKSDSADEVVAAVESLRARSFLFAALDTLENLKKGGRIGAAGAFFGSLLSVKPIVTLREGEVQAESRQRTRGRALQYLFELVEARAPIDHVIVGHSNAPDLERFLELLSPLVPRKSIEISYIGPVVGTHTGTGLIAISFASGATTN